MYILKIKEIRSKKKISATYMAKALNCSRSYYWCLENNKYHIKLITICQIASILNVDPCELFEVI